jgi:hypothetical protein
LTSKSVIGSAARINRSKNAPRNFGFLKKPILKESELFFAFSMLVLA